MKIAIVNTLAPFIYGNTEYLAESLCQKLNEQGYRAMVVKIPFNSDSEEKIAASLLSTRLINFCNIDKVIALQFPAYNVNHPNKVIWIARLFYTNHLFPQPSQEAFDAAFNPSIQQMIINTDNHSFKQASKIFTRSQANLQALQKVNNIDAELLYPPLLTPEKFHCSAFGNYFFYPGRINNIKRQHLAVKAMRYTKSKAKLLIAGKPDHPDDLRVLNKMVEQYQLKDKVYIVPEWISEQQKIELMADCIGCIYIPYKNDTCGYVPLEALHAKKPAISCIDSGEVTTLIKHNETGLLASPQATDLAYALDHLYQNKIVARTLGEAGYEQIKQLNLTWENVLRKLMQ